VTLHRILRDAVPTCGRLSGQKIPSPPGHTIQRIIQRIMKTYRTHKKEFV